MEPLQLPRSPWAESRREEAGGDAAGDMLGKDYMLAIILVNCDGVHEGAWWEKQELRGKGYSEAQSWGWG